MVEVWLRHIGEKIAETKGLQGVSRLEVSINSEPLNASLTLLVRTRADLSRKMLAAPSRHYPLELIQNIQHIYAQVQVWEERGRLRIPSTAPVEMAILFSVDHQFQSMADIQNGLVFVPVFNYQTKPDSGLVEDRLAASRDKRASTLLIVHPVPKVSIVHVPDEPSLSGAKLTQLTHIANPWNFEQAEPKAYRQGLVAELRAALEHAEPIVHY